MNQGYQPSIATQGFQPELPINNSGSVSVPVPSGTTKFFKGLVKVMLIIGGIMLIIPGILLIVCLFILFLASLNILPLLNMMGTGTILLSGFTLLNNKKLSKKYFPFLLFTIIFSMLFLAGQYDVQSFNCPLHYNYNLFIPIIQLFVSIIGFLGFFYNGFLLIRKSKN